MIVRVSGPGRGPENQVVTEILSLQGAADMAALLVRFREHLVEIGGVESTEGFIDWLATSWGFQLLDVVDFTVE